LLAIVALASVLAVSTAYRTDPATAKGVVVKLGNRQTNRLTRLGTSGPVVPMQGNLTFWAEFFVEIGLGTPPQKMLVDIDTGSTDLIVYTPGCSGCPSKPYKSYNPGASSSSNQVWCSSSSYNCNSENCFSSMDPCTWEDDYAGGSDMTGDVYRDVMTIGGVTTQGPIAFGGITQASFPPGQPFQPDGISGLAGMAFQPLSGFGASNWFDQFVFDYSWYAGFSLCLNTLNGDHGGALSLGVDYSKDSRFLFTALTEEEWWNIALNDIKIGGKSLGLTNWDYNNEGVIVDSGTTLLIVTNLIMKSIRTSFESMCDNTPLVGVCGTKPGKSMFDGYCFGMTNAQLSAFPTLTFNIPGWGDVSWDSTDYLWEGAGVDGLYCLGIQALAPGSNTGVIIGDVLMQKFHLFFDRNNDQIGLAHKSTCPTPKA
jgi:hypothetical protein